MHQTIPIAATPATSKRTCDQLGICQGRTIPCLNCTRPDAQAWPPADDATATPSSFEQIWAWFITLVLAAVAVGCIGLLACAVVFMFSHALDGVDV